MNDTSIKGQLQQTWQTIVRLRVTIFLVVSLVIYGFIGWRISALTNAQPSQTAIDSKATKMSTPSIDPAVVDKVKQLEDNNVNVQALFDQARQNPFRE